jgi:endo-1,4-beta-xylanase
MVVLGCCLAGARGLPSTAAGERAALKDCYRARDKECGTAVMPMGMGDEAYKQILARQFSLVLPDYGMYMSDLQPRRDVWDFASADRLVEFAKTNQLKIRGHVLIYDYPTSRHGEKWTPTPRWVYDGHYSRDEMLRIMNKHIETVMRHYQDSISQWIVVNEAVGNFLPGQMESTIWLKGIGKDYVDRAFQRAHQIAPKAELIINDYGADYLGQLSCGPFKANSFYNYVKQLREKGVPVNAVGLQFHLIAGLDHPDAERIENNFARFHALAVKVYVSELDIRIQAPVTEQKLAEQARLYKLVMDTALRSPSCAGLTLWGYTDKYSWIDTFKAFPGCVDACLFDANLQAKSFFPSLLQTLGSNQTQLPRADPPLQGMKK